MPARTSDKIMVLIRISDLALSESAAASTRTEDDDAGDLSTSTSNGNSAVSNSLGSIIVSPIARSENLSSPDA